MISASVTKEGIRAEEVHHDHRDQKIESSHRHKTILGHLQASGYDWSKESTSAASLARHYKEIDDAKLLAKYVFISESEDDCNIN